MYELSNLKQDRQAQEIYRYFKESFIYLENPPARINTKTLPKLPKLTELPIEIQEGPLSLLPTRLTSLMSAGVLQILHDNLIALIPETFISFCHEELITLLHREKDYKSFLSHHFNQKLLALFVGLDSNTHSITLHHFATIHDDFFALSKLLLKAALS